ncbi:MAG TPA: hypothetical protein VNU71_03630 [Burkholderiaceae bacterium]|nr:hypothetical protein [Burkholderiaceae bacterium]
MNAAPHEFVTVDMRGLKAALVALAREQRVSVSVVVRDAVAKALPPNGDIAIGESSVAGTSGGGTVKLSIRLTADEAVRLDRGAKDAGLSRGAFLSGLINGVGVPSSGGRAEHLAAVIASNAELSTLSRNVRNLANLLGRSEMRAAQAYRTMLDTLAGDVERHLDLAGDLLTQLRPSRGAPEARKPQRRPRRKET